MKLIIDASAIRPAKLDVVDGDNIIYTVQVYGPELIAAIDKIFQTRYIESVQFKQYNNYTQKFIDHIENAHPGTIVMFNYEEI